LELTTNIGSRSIFSVKWSEFISKNNKLLNIDNSDNYTLNCENGTSYSIEHAWDLINIISPLIERALSVMEFKSSDLKAGIILISNSNEFVIHPDCRIKGQTIVNTEKGPVIIDSGVILKNFNSIEGPAYIGQDTILDNCQIKGPVITGKECRLSGEIEESIIFNYVNKHHFGFLGHSVVLDWVNLGAGTTNSDLKNNYGNIKMFNGKNYVDTNCMKIGCIIGDHTKTAIGTMINTGTIIGPFCNIFTDIRNEKHIPPFVWGENGKYDFQKLKENINKSMMRRNVSISDEYESQIFELFRKYSDASEQHS